MKLKIDMSSYGSSYSSDEEFGKWHSSKTNDLNYVSISEDNYGEPIDFTVKRGRRCIRCLGRILIW